MKRRRLSWITREGSELEEENARSQLDVLVPREPGIYTWRRSTQVLEESARSPKILAREVEKFIRMPIGRINARALAHYIWLDGLLIGGTELPNGRAEELGELFSDQRKRRAFLDIVSAAVEIAPPLYVGETDNLYRRTREHLTGQTQFAERLKAEWNQGPGTLRLSFVSTAEVPAEDEDEARTFRTLSELLVSRLTLATLTSRPG
jgi:hypothetical protein